MIRFPAGIDAEVFLRDYWQRKPLLIRQGLPGFDSPLTPDELAGLALEEDVESRAILEQGFQLPWELHHGPFDTDFFAGLPALPWTLLVQGADLWVPEVEAILDEFSFLPRWRIDDIMISYASDGGGVGPHFDYYDVFLIQGMGRRRWSVGQTCGPDTPLREGTNLGILDTFDAADTWILEPGDILYLPPCIAHEGVAEDESMTYSVGFRAPTAGEMLDDLATEVISRGGGGHFRDPPLSPAMAGERIDPAFIEQTRQLLLEALDDRDLLATWFAAYMTRPKYPALELYEDIPPRRAILEGSAGKRERLFVNGCDESEEE